MTKDLLRPRCDRSRQKFLLKMHSKVTGEPWLFNLGVRRLQIPAIDAVKSRNVRNCQIQIDYAILEAFRRKHGIYHTRIIFERATDPIS